MSNTGDWSRRRIARPANLLCIVGLLLLTVLPALADVPESSDPVGNPTQLLLESFDSYATTADLFGPTKLWDYATTGVGVTLTTGDSTTVPKSGDIKLVSGTSDSSFCRMNWTLPGFTCPDIRSYNSLIFDAKVIRGGGAYRPPPAPIGFSVNLVGAGDINNSYWFVPSAYDTWQTFRINIAGNAIDQLSYARFYINRCSISDTNQILRLDNICVSTEPAGPASVTNPLIDDFETGDITWWYYNSYHGTYSGVTHALTSSAATGQYALKITNYTQPPAFTGSSYAYCRKTIQQDWSGYTTLWFDAKMANSNTNQGFQVALKQNSASLVYYAFYPATSWQTYSFDISALQRDEITQLLFYVNKTSQNRNQELYLDNIRLIDSTGATYSSVAAAKAGANGTVTINGAVVTGALPATLPDASNPATMHRVFFIEDANRVSAVPVVWDTANIAEGNIVNVTGSLQVDRGNRVIYAVAANPVASGTPAKPLGMANKNCAGLPAAKLDTVGMLVTTVGRVLDYRTDILGRHWLYVDDGSNVVADLVPDAPNQPVQMRGVKVLDGSGMLEGLVGSYVVATGFAMNEPEIDPNSTPSPLVLTGRYCRALWPKMELAEPIRILQSGSGGNLQYAVVTILHTNDLHGSVLPTDGQYGLVRAATLVRQIRAEMPNVLLLDGGDIIHGTPEEYFSGGQAITTAMNAAGYSASATGNHEYDFFLSTLQGVMATAAFPFVAANVRTVSGGQWDRLGQYAILDAGGVKIGILGLATLDTVSLEWPPNIAALAFTDPYGTASALVPVLRSQADVVVVLSHLGEAADEALASQVPGIDFIVGGHSHTILDTWRWVGNTLIAQTGAYGHYLGRIDFIAKIVGTTSEIVSVNGKTQNWGEMSYPPLGKHYATSPLLTVDNLVPEDATVKAAYMPYRTSTDAHMAEVLGQAAQAISGGSTSLDETAIRDFVADAVRSYAASDVSILDSSSISNTGLAAGSITVGMGFNLIGGFTRQQIIVGRMLGSSLNSAMQSRASGTGAFGYAVSGMSFDYTHPGATNIKVGGVALNPSAYYTVASQAYIMQILMNTAPGTVITAEMTGTTREAIFGYVQGLGTVYPPTVGRVHRM